MPFREAPHPSLSRHTMAESTEHSFRVLTSSLGCSGPTIAINRNGIQDLVIVAHAGRGEPPPLFSPKFSVPGAPRTLNTQLQHLSSISTPSSHPRPFPNRHKSLCSVLFPPTMCPYVLASGGAPVSVDSSLLRSISGCLTLCIMDILVQIILYCRGAILCIV